jgi:pectate lyase
MWQSLTPEEGAKEMKKSNVMVKIGYMVFMLMAICVVRVFASPCGDVNSSGSIDIVDALLTAQYAVGLNPSNFDSGSADVNGDGSINIVDALLIAQYSVGLITSLPGCVETPVPTPVPTSPPVTPDGNLVGFASVNGGTTGGTGGTTVTVSDSGALKDAIRSDGATIVRVQGIIGIGTIVIQNVTNKTIIGAGTGSGWNGNIQFKGCSNFIIQNLNISAPGNGDGITIQDESHHFWVDHCAFGDCSDGQLDITHGSDYITVSWCKFSYTDSGNDHRFCNLIGHDDDNSAEDSGKLHVTFHHNWWGTLCHERMPRLRYGRVHLFNNYFNASGNNYCASSRIGGQMLIQNNYFQRVSDPWDSQQGGLVNASGNTLDNCSGSSSPAGDSVFSPPYACTLESASAARSSVMSGAGPH